MLPRKSQKQSGPPLKRARLADDDFSPIQDLPIELIIHILAFLEPREIARVASVSSAFFGLVFNFEVKKDVVFNSSPAEDLTPVLQNDSRKRKHQNIEEEEQTVSIISETNIKNTFSYLNQLQQAPKLAEFVRFFEENRATEGAELFRQQSIFYDLALLIHKKDKIAIETYIANFIGEDQQDQNAILSKRLALEQCSYFKIGKKIHWSWLGLATKKGDLALVKCFMAIHGSRGITKTLLDIFDVKHAKTTPLQIAIRKNHFHLVSYFAESLLFSRDLLAFSFPPNTKNLFHDIIILNDLPLLTYFVKRLKQVDLLQVALSHKSSVKNLVMIAAENGYEELFNYLAQTYETRGLFRDFTPTRREYYIAYSLLYFAVQGGNENIIRTCLNRGEFHLAKLGLDYTTTYAITPWHQPEEIQTLIKQNRRLSKFLDTLPEIFFTEETLRLIFQNSFHITQQLIDYYLRATGDINKEDDQGRSLLDIIFDRFCEGQNFEWLTMFQLLLMNGAKFKDNQFLLHKIFQITPWGNSSLYDMLQVSKLINIYVSEGGDINEENQDGKHLLDIMLERTPLTRVPLKVLEILLEHKVQFSSTNISIITDRIARYLNDEMRAYIEQEKQRLASLEPMTFQDELKGVGPSRGLRFFPFPTEQTFEEVQTPLESLFKCS